MQQLMQTNSKKLIDQVDFKTAKMTEDLKVIQNNVTKLESKLESGLSNIRNTNLDYGGPPPRPGASKTGFNKK
jgi:hypothetical protein